jgi:SAM-dependent methyltransferase
MSFDGPELRVLRKRRQSVIEREMAWHENEAAKRYALDRLLYGPPAFDKLLQQGSQFLNQEPGKLVLDMACGEGKETLAFALQGLRVIGVDLSHSQLLRTRQLIESHAAAEHVHFVQANVEQLPFARNTLPAVFGKAILHHVDVSTAQHEVLRVLKPCGRATFAEPLSDHPLFRLARKLTPQWRTLDEHPLTYGELQDFANSFAQSETGAAFLLAPVAYVLRLVPGLRALFRPVHSSLQRLDRALFKYMPMLRQMAWYGLIFVHNVETLHRDGN